MRRRGRNACQLDYFDACVTRFMQAQEHAAAAGLRLTFMSDRDAQDGWRCASGAPANAVPYGHILVVLMFGPGFRQSYLSIAQNILDRASPENPTPLLVASQAIDRAVRDFQAQAVQNMFLALNTYTAAYVRQHGRLVSFGVRGQDNPLSSSSRWLKRFLTSANPVLAIARSGSHAGVKIRAAIAPSASASTSIPHASTKTN